MTNSLLAAARTASRLEQWDDAEALLRRCLLSRPQSSEAWFQLGRVLSERGDLSGAIDAYRSSLARNPESSLSDGDEERYFVRVRGDSGGRRRDHAFDWALRYRARDSTYVSRFTGMVATDGAGNEIGDRFDNSMGDLRAAWHFPGSDYGRVSIEGSVLTKNYLTDYASLGLERLDYNRFGITPEYELRGRVSNLRIDLILAMRQYRDRRVSDVSGNPVAGTDLEYRYYGVRRTLRARTHALFLRSTGSIRRHPQGVLSGKPGRLRPASATRRQAAPRLPADSVPWRCRVPPPDSDSAAACSRRP